MLVLQTAKATGESAVLYTKAATALFRGQGWWLKPGCAKVNSLRGTQQQRKQQAACTISLALSGAFARESTVANDVMILPTLVPFMPSNGGLAANGVDTE